MDTIKNLIKIREDLNSVPEKKEYYSNVSERLDKILKWYISQLEIQYNQMLNKNTKDIMKELIK
jgi:hypothetical protein